MKYIILLFSLLTGCLQVQAQRNTECITEVVSQFQKVSNWTPKGDKNFYMRFNTKIVMRDNIESPNTDIDVTMIAGKGQIQYVTKEATLMMDNKDVFLIVNHTKDIYWNKSLGLNSNNPYNNQLLQLRDSVMLQASVKECIEIQLNGKQYKKVVLEPGYKNKQTYHIERMTFLIDKQKGMLYQVKVDYTNRYKIQSYVNTYYELDMNYKYDFSKPVYNKVFASNQRLLNQYREYTLTDNR